VLVAEEQPLYVDLRGTARGAAAHGHPPAPPKELESQFCILAAEVIENRVSLPDLIGVCEDTYRNRLNMT
jgi:hypothetical protein